MKQILILLLLAGCSLCTRAAHPLQADSLVAQARALHARIFSIDTHTDTPLDFTPYYNIRKREKTQVCLPKMAEGCLDAQYLACWVRQGECDSIGRQKAIRRIHTLIEGVNRQIEMNRDACGLARTPDELRRLKAEGKKAFCIGIENGYAIGTDLSLLEHYHRQGVTYMTLCHSRNNDICDSSSDKVGARWKGLSPFGRRVVAEMNRLGMLIDLSHAAESTFWEVSRLSKAPLFASHSVSRQCHNHDRNLTDRQLEAIAHSDGVVQACLVPEFLTSPAKSATIDDFMRHLQHLIEVAGIDHVGIGTDFDGGGGVKGCNGDDELIQITVRLLQLGYSEEQIAHIWGGNFLRVMAATQALATR